MKRECDIDNHPPGVVLGEEGGCHVYDEGCHTNLEDL
jgi:hypothetical protein